MKRSKVILLAVLLGLASGTTMAEEGRAYGVFELGQGNVPKACDGLPANFSCTTKTTAFRVGFGYQVNKFVGLEAAYLDGGRVNASGLGVTAYESMSGVQFSVVGALPVTSEVAILGKVGVAYIDGTMSATSPIGGVFATSTGNYSNTNTTYGLGVRFTGSGKIAIRVLFEDYGTVKASNTDTGSPMSIVSVGLQVKL